MEKLIHLLNQTLKDHSFVRCIWSKPRSKSSYSKVIATPILIKNELVLQLGQFKNNKVYHENIKVNDYDKIITQLCISYKQIQLYTLSHTYHCLINKKGEIHTKKVASTLKTPINLEHNRKKNYILNTTASQDFLHILGLTNEQGHIKSSKYDKYKQINRYLEFIDDCMKYLNKPFIRIIDFGCGKSYLTFAVYHYLTHVLNKQVEIIGLDLKEDVIDFCNDLAQQLHYEQLHFQVGDIGHYTTSQPIDMVISLHACDIATDLALEKAISWGAKVILAVPCCHHEAYKQIQNQTLTPLLKHGILKERIAALVTDGLRAQLLESCGYQVTVMEFIDMEHTPKNILIRAILKEKVHFNPKAYQTYQQTSEALHLNLSLETYLKTHHLLSEKRES